MVTDEERRQDVTVTIPPVRAFSHVAPDKAHALKPLEEASEIHAAWYLWYGRAILDGGDSVFTRVQKKALVDECCDVIQATCNLLAALGVTDLTEAMAACERRNRERGRYGD